MADGVIVVSLADATSPSELYAYDGDLARLTEVSGESLAGISRAAVEKRRFESRDGTEVEAFFVKPVDYQEGQSYRRFYGCTVVRLPSLTGATMKRPSFSRQMGMR